MVLGSHQMPHTPNLTQSYPQKQCDSILNIQKKVIIKFSDRKIRVCYQDFERLFTVLSFLRKKKKKERFSKRIFKWLWPSFKITKKN